MDILKLSAIIIISAMALFLLIDRICKCVEECIRLRAVSDTYNNVVKNNKVEPEEKK